MSIKEMSYTDQMEISEMDEIINDSFCNDESSNDFNGTLQVTTMTSIVSHAQNSGKSIPLHKTRSGLKYNTTNESLTLKRVSSSASCSFTGNESPSPSKILNTDHMTVLVHSDLITSLDDVTQDVEDDEDDAMEYDAEDQNESAVSSPQTSTNKYKLNASSSIDNKCDGNVKCPDYTIDDNSLISSTLSTIIDPNAAEFPSFNVNVEQTVVHRQTRQRLKRGLKSVSRKMLKPSKLLFADKLSTKIEKEESIFLMPRYPLRSRARLEKVKTRLRESVVGSKNLDTLPVEIYYKIFQYLPIQDLFRIQRINKRFKDAVDNHLVMVKRINFSCGLPFAFLPDCLNDSVLKRILSKTPEVTHILGFYPRKIEDVPGIDNSLTYGGIMSALRQCSKLRSVEIMDLELMSRVVHAMGRVKFHGMFRNRPYSWEDEFANPLLNKPTNSISAVQNAANTTTLIPPITAGSLPLFENNTEQRQTSTKYGFCNKLSSSLCNFVGLQQINNKDLYMNFINYSWLSFLEQMGYTATGQGLPLLQPINQGPFVNLVTPIPPSIDKLIIPTTINNLTKLDLVSVCIQHLPRLENIKYLHLKWVRFSSPDPFMNFQAPKIQSFVMNNCIGPIRGMRYVRIFTALARSTQLNRLELVSTRIVESLFENFFFDNDQGHRCFRNLQRLVLASNKEFGEVDVATLLLSSHASLNHLALSVSHSRNSLMLSLVNAHVVMQKLESVILGYQDPFQSMLTGVEIHNLGLHDSPDHSLPICKITDRGLAALMKLAPKLVSLHLRHAIYVEDPMLWLSNNWPYPIGKKPINPYADNNEEPEDQSQNNFFLKSLILENCPGIRPESISFILNHPATGFPQLEMLVLRDMFPPLPKCAIPQAEIDYSLFNNCFHRDDRKQSLLSCCPPKVLSCRGKLVNYSVMNKKDSRIKTQLMDGLSDRFCCLPHITSPGGCSSTNNQTQESFILNHNSHNNSSINVGDIIDNPANPAANRFSRIFISNLTSNGINNNNNNSDSGMFGMGSTGLALHNAAGAQVLGAQHTNLGTSIRPNEILRPPMIVNAMKNITMLHRLENLGLGKTALWDNYRLSSFGKNHHGQPYANNVSDMSSKISKRKRSRSNEQSNQMIHGLYFHNSLVPKSKFSKPLKKDQNKQEKSTKKRKIKDQAWVDSTKTEDHIFDFQSTGTQTCVCGHIDWLDSLWQRDIALFDDLNSQWHVIPTMRNKQGDTVHNSTINSPHKSPNNKSNTGTNTTSACQTSYINISEYGCRLCSLPVDNDSNPSTISATQPELYLEHRPREWQAQNAAVDTMSLRLYLKQQLYSLDLKQNSFAHLTTLHLEKVGITHLVLSSCHRLKSITLENCPELQAIVINTGTAPPSDSMPNLRRIRIMRCPKFAIYNLLYNITRFYPQHDDNLYITYRPFGEYNPLVEKALWINSDSQHVMVSHEYRQASSERNLEELCSSFDQLFREMLNFSESLIRRDILTVSDFSRVNYFTNGSFLRSEHGTDWDLLTDIPWISEVCCSMLPSDLTRTQQADQLYELLSEIQSHLGHMKLRRRGIHFHVQFRDVHKPWMIDSSSLINDIIADSTPYSYLPCAYTDRYLESTHPRDDINANYCEPNLHEMYPDLCTANNVAHNYEEEEDEEQSELIAELYRMSHSNVENNTNSSSNSNHSNQSSNSSGSSSISSNSNHSNHENSNVNSTLLSMLPPHLRDLLNDHMTLSPDINERVPIPQQHSTNLTTNPATSKPTSLRATGRLATDIIDSNHNTNTAQLNDTTSPPLPPSSTSAEYMANKIYKFRATITALKKSSNDSSSSSSQSLATAPVAATTPDCAHSTRSRTAEMTQNNSNNNNRH